MKNEKTHTYLYGNWKMNPKTLDEALVLLTDLTKLSKKFHAGSIRLAVPSVFLYPLVKQAKGVLEIGVQNVHELVDGAHTGDVSVNQALSSGARFTIIGHSERRALGETDEVLNKKVLAAVTQNMGVVLCVGETVRDKEGLYLKTIKSQVMNALKDVPQKFMKHITIAYEPVWAIGAQATGVATPVESQEVAILIRRTIRDMYSEAVSKKVVILYGGSASSANAKSFLDDGGVQGFLLGRASLDIEEMTKLTKV